MRRRVRARGSGRLRWAVAVLEEAGQIVASASHAAPASPFTPGQLALREGPLLDSAVRGLPVSPDVLLVAAAGRDHPRRAGLALHLGAALDVPTVGVIDDPLLATGDQPEPAWASRAPLRLGGETLGYRVRTRRGAKPLVAHAAWRTCNRPATDVLRAPRRPENTLDGLTASVQNLLKENAAA